MSKKQSIFSRYLRYMREAPKHIQQLHALFFSASVTIFFAACILYFDYGFWHERYQKSEEITVEQKIEATSLSPTDLFSGFFREAGEKLDTVKKGGSALLEGKESYSKREEYLSSTSTEEGE